MSIFFCIEDGLSRAVAKRLISEFCPQFTDIRELGKAHGGYGYIRKNIGKFYELARQHPVLIITDLDREECPPSLRRKWLSIANIEEPLPVKMVFCIAQSEVESWLLADVGGIANFLKISPAKIDISAEFSSRDAKEYLVRLASMSRDATIRRDLVPQRASMAKVGISYEFQLCKFVDDNWNIFDASNNSISLKRAITKMQSLSDL